MCAEGDIRCIIVSRARWMQRRPGSGNRALSVSLRPSFNSCGSFARFHIPHDQLRVFSSSSRQGLEEQLEQENKGLASTSVTAAQFLRERRLQPPAEVQQTSEPERETSLEKAPIAGISQQPVDKPGWGLSALESRSMSALEMRREELERSPTLITISLTSSACHSLCRKSSPG